MNLSAFRVHIKTCDHATLDAYHDEIRAKASRARSPATRLGYALALDELAIESEIRRQPVDAEAAGMNDDELLAALTA
jgi:hypothetical protein